MWEKETVRGLEFHEILPPPPVASANYFQACSTQGFCLWSPALPCSFQLPSGSSWWVGRWGSLLVSKTRTQLNLEPSADTLAHIFQSCKYCSWFLLTLLYGDHSFLPCSVTSEPDWMFFLWRSLSHFVIQPTVCPINSLIGQLKLWFCSFHIFHIVKVWKTLLTAFCRLKRNEENSDSFPWLFVIVPSQGYQHKISS